MNHPRHLMIVHDVLLQTLDLYSHKLTDWSLNDEEEDDGAGKEVVSLIGRIGKRVRRGVDDAQMAGNMMGCLEILEAG